MFVDPNGFGISAWKIRAVVVLTGNGNGSFVLIGLTFTRMLTISIVDRLLHCVLVVVWSLVYSLFFLFFFLSLSLSFLSRYANVLFCVRWVLGPGLSGVDNSLSTNRFPLEATTANKLLYAVGSRSNGSLDSFIGLAHHHHQLRHWKKMATQN